MADHSPTDIPPQDTAHPLDAAHSLLFRVGETAKPWLDFWTKLNNDWVFNLSGLLAYNFLMSLFPILLVLLAAVGIVLGGLASQVLADMQQLFEQLVPGGAEVFAAVTHQLTNSARPLLIIGVVTAAFTGSRLFLVLENCFGIIFRVRGRHFVRQNLMAIGMFLLYLVLAPVIALASVIPSTIVSIVAPHVHDSALPFLSFLLGIVVSSVSALVLIGGIYLVVPNRPMRLSEIWPGAVLASILLVLYVALFPLYVNLFLHPGNYGAVAGFAVVILLFFYYLAFILLLGAEVNSWRVGLRPTPG
ncbi:MAG TPA: YihY/virulence factor BrkB family protein, partial [Ktedonobacterales bacterium]|nr:YihY/virulence factor BrkB family protein [Ktedonobacterales bacterium]